MRLAKPILALSLLALAGVTAAAAKPTEADRLLLAGYEAVRAALAADNLEGARAAAGAMPGNANATVIARADSLNTARIAFKRLSAEAIAVGAGLPGFAIVHCPMVGADWLQTSRNISNPYLGKNSSCGRLKPSP